MIEEKDNNKPIFFEEFNEYPTHLSLLSYDLVGLVYYLSLKRKNPGIQTAILNREIMPTQFIDSLRSTSNCIK